ncbi:scramblase family protein, putative, partial [Ichthyophthirius multifiliis]
NNKKQKKFQMNTYENQHFVADSNLKCLADAKQVLLIQKTDWAECICPICDLPNEYDIFLTDETYTQTLTQIGTIVEKSNICCSICCRQFRQFESRTMIGGTEVAQTERPYKIPSPCLANFGPCKQQIEVKKNGQNLGGSEWPCWCNTLCCFRGFCSCQELDVTDSVGNVAYRISSKCLQCGYLLPVCFCFQSCARRHYPIKNTNGQVVGEITNICNGVCLELCTKADKFAVRFPAECTTEQKLIILQTAMFIDYLQYESFC